jgi:hypothetical protein
MATTPQQFFDKNMKWIALALLFLLIITGIGSCNKGMRLQITSGQYTHEIDSLKKQYVDYRDVMKDSIKKLNFELQLAKERANMANDRASAVQSAVEKLRTNTTITVKGAEEVKDTTKKRK